MVLSEGPVDPNELAMFRMVDIEYAATASASWVHVNSYLKRDPKLGPSNPRRTYREILVGAPWGGQETQPELVVPGKATQAHSVMVQWRQGDVWIAAIALLLDEGKTTEWFVEFVQSIK